MAQSYAKGVIDRRFQLVVLDIPTLLAEAGDASSDLCRRVQALLECEVRVVLMASDEQGNLSDRLCLRIPGSSKVFLFVWTSRGELQGFDQGGLMVRLAQGPPESPEAAADLIMDSVAAPADITAEGVLVIGESFGPGGRDLAFMGKRYAGARLVALAEAEDLPPEVRQVPPGRESVIGLLDALRWVWG